MVIYLQNLKISHQRVCEHWKHQVSVKYTSTIKLLLSFISITIQPHFRILIYCSIVCVYSDLFLICSILQITWISAINQNADWWKYCRRNAIYSDLLVYYGYLMADDALSIRIWFFRLWPVVPLYLCGAMATTSPCCDQKDRSCCSTTTRAKTGTFIILIGI